MPKELTEGAEIDTLCTSDNENTTYHSPPTKPEESALDIFRFREDPSDEMYKNHMKLCKRKLPPIDFDDLYQERQFAPEYS